MLALGLLALPVLYLGLVGIVGALLIDLSGWPILVMWTLPSFLILSSACGTLLSFRHALMTAVALAVFYVAWALTVYPFSIMSNNLIVFSARLAMVAVLGVNLVWMAWRVFTGRNACN